MAYGIRLEVWGDHACFTRPEFSVERVSYDVITPSAARGILESIFWHPGMRYVIDRICVLNPVRFTNIRRNEVKSKALSSSVLSYAKSGGELPYINTRDEIVQRAAMVLTDVKYVLEAHFEMTDEAKEGDNPGKFADIIRRRLAKGQCYSMPYFGVREFPAHFKPASKPETYESYYRDEANHDFGFMLYDMDYTNKDDIRPMYYRAVMKHGVIDVPSPGSEGVLK